MIFYLVLLDMVLFLIHWIISQLKSFKFFIHLYHAKNSKKYFLRYIIKCSKKNCTNAIVQFCNMIIKVNYPDIINHCKINK